MKLARKAFSGVTLEAVHPVSSRVIIQEGESGNLCIQKQSRDSEAARGQKEHLMWFFWGQSGILCQAHARALSKVFKMNKRTPTAKCCWSWRISM